VETSGRLDCGVCAAVDVHYLSTGGTRSAAVLAADVAFARVLAEHTAVLPRVPPYRPGQFYPRELPPLRAVLDELSGLGLLVVDGYADLDPGGRPGLGAHAHAASRHPGDRGGQVPVPHRDPRGTGRARILGTPLFVTAATMPGADAADLVRCMAGRYRLPDALRRADSRRLVHPRSHHDRPPV
jgi:deoxyribonuclease V